jgi:uncharacterized protein (DUF4213/DUF364 family)
MNKLMENLKQELLNIMNQYNLSDTEIMISTRSLTPEEAIGITERKDFPILVGKEIMLQTTYMDGVGQSFTSSPSAYKGTLMEILKMDIVNDEHARSLFIAALNAVLKHTGLISNTVHCKDGEPELCAGKMVSHVRLNYHNPKIALIGYQPALLENLSKEFELRVLDLNPDNIGQKRYGTLVEDGIKDFDAVVNDWADLILCTGSTICNASIVNFINLDKEVLFFGTTLAGAAHIMGWKRACFYSV